MALPTPLKVSITLKRLLVLTSNSVTYVARVDEVYGVNLCNHVTHRKSRIPFKWFTLKKDDEPRRAVVLPTSASARSCRQRLRQHSLRSAYANAERARDLA